MMRWFLPAVLAAALVLALALEAGCSDDSSESATDTGVDLGADTGATDSASDGAGLDVPDASDTPGDTPDDTEPTPPVCLDYGSPEKVGNLPDFVTECSGIAFSGRDPDLFWVHDDSGGDAHIVGVRTDGTHVATATLEVAFNNDWEDAVSGPCEPGGPARGCVYVGDIGDNATIRPFVTIFRIPEPDATLGDQALVKGTGYELTKLAYPDEPHDCEAMIVGPNADVWLFTKEWAQSGVTHVYRAPFTPGDINDDPTTMEKVTTLVLEDAPKGMAGLVTGADWSPSLGRVLLRTYGNAIELRLPPGQSLTGTALDVATSLGAAEQVEVPSGPEIQGEAIAYGPHGEGYVHAAEGAGAAIWRVSCE